MLDSNSGYQKTLSAGVARSTTKPQVRSGKQRVSLDMYFELFPSGALEFEFEFDHLVGRFPFAKTQNGGRRQGKRGDEGREETREETRGETRGETREETKEETREEMKETREEEQAKTKEEE